MGVHIFFMSYTQQAKEVLEGNWRSGYTIPSSTLYPFQWNWDAGFHALGWMYVKPENALEEVRSIFKGQWKNGMLPHIVFHQPNENYFPGPVEWKTELAENKAEGVETSGITQLPVFGFFLERMDQIADEIGFDIKSFILELFPKVLQFHRYLYTERDPLKEGLPFVIHNWESTDNAPIWDAIWETMNIDAARDVSLLRKDLKNVDASMRPTHEHYKRYIYLIDLLVQKKYDTKQLLGNYPFLVQENFFISLLIRSNEGLIKLAKKYNIECAELEQWQMLSKKSFLNKFWDEHHGNFYPYDLNTKSLIKKDIVGSFVSLFAGIPTKEQAKRLVQLIESDFELDENCYLCASYSPKAKDFDSKKYWRGPLWPNVNWLLYHGLKRYGYEDLANKIKKQTIHLIETVGFYEYFNPAPNQELGKQDIGLGGHHFSWTSAIYLDFKNNTVIL
jgi:hypothetical protein